MVIGITGGIGSGKSTITRELAKRGFAVYDCDREAKRIIAKNANVQQAIIALLGKKAFEEGKYNTAYVAQRVFAEPHLLTQLNAIVHPAVKEDILQRSGLTAKRSNSEAVQQAKPVLFIESAILYEAGLDRLCDRVIYIDAPEEIRIARTVARDHCNAEQVRARIATQTILPHKNAIVLMNDGTKSIETLTTELLNRLKTHI